MGKGAQKIKRFIKFFDMFSTPNMLRIEDEPDYKSMSGAFISLSLIILFVAVFTNTVVSTFNYTNISSTITQSEESEPTFLSTSDDPFMFAVGLTNINLNDPNTKYFNIVFSNVTQYINGTKKTTYVNLVPCQKSAWTAINPSFGDSFDRIGFKNWLCLPPNITLEFQGKYSSQVFRYAKISVQNCSIGAGDNRTCATPAFISNFITSAGSATFNYYFVNTVINSQDSEYLSYYLEDRNYFTFTNNLGMLANIFISSFTIDTDVSLWPTNEIKEDTGGLVHQTAQTFVFQPTTEYLKLYLRKSSLSLSVTRTFQKVDDTLSYIGGLFSTIIAFLFFMSKFSEFAYQIRIASYLFKYDKETKIKDNHFNLFTFIPYCFYLLLNLIGKPPNWKTMHHLDQTREEVGKQIDFPFLLRRIHFLEETITYLFEDYELNCLHMKKKITLDEASKRRRLYSRSKRLLKIANKEAKSKDPQKCSINQDISGIIINNELIQTTNVRSTNNNIKEKSEMEVSAEEETNQFDNQSDSGYESSQIDSQDEKEIFNKSLQSLEMLEKRANEGHARSAKIFNHMHKDFLDILETNRKSKPPIIQDVSVQEAKSEKRQAVVVDGYHHFEFDSIANIE